MESTINKYEAKKNEILPSDNEIYEYKFAYKNIKDILYAMKNMLIGLLHKLRILKPDKDGAGIKKEALRVMHGDAMFLEHISQLSRELDSWWNADKHSGALDLFKRNLENLISRTPQQTERAFEVITTLIHGNPGITKEDEDIIFRLKDAVLKGKLAFLDNSISNLTLRDAKLFHNVFIRCMNYLLANKHVYALNDLSKLEVLFKLHENQFHSFEHQSIVSDNPNEYGVPMILDSKFLNPFEEGYFDKHKTHVKTPVSYEEALNPFGDDEDEFENIGNDELENTLTDQSSVSYEEALNPFGDDEDDVENILSDQPVAPSYEESLNLFADDESEIESTLTNQLHDSNEHENILPDQSYVTNDELINPFSDDEHESENVLDDQSNDSYNVDNTDNELNEQSPITDSKSHIHYYFDSEHFDGESSV